MNKNIVRKKIFNIISEMYQLSEQESESNQKIISVLNKIANGEFPKQNIKFFDSNQMDFQEMLEKNNFSKKGEAIQTEYPVLEIKTEDGDTFQFPIQIKKQYSYEFFTDVSFGESDADIFLDNVEIVTQQIEVNDKNNNIYKINLKESLGDNIIKKLELQLKKLLK
jgi:hypothetical protein